MDRLTRVRGTDHNVSSLQSETLHAVRRLGQPVPGVLMDWVKAGWFFATSFFKRSWDLTDYPVRVREFEAQEPRGRFGTPFTWSAQVINWWTMSGQGYSRAEALANLEKSFAAFKALPKSLPRPGSRVPFEFATTERLAKHEALVADFIERIFGPYEAYFVSDESSLWDFHERESNDFLHEKILEVYGVDVSDIESGLIADILDRIAAHSPPARH